MTTIETLCKSHNRRSYFDGGNGLIGVYNHANMVCWYRWTVAGYSQTGSTITPEGAELIKLGGKAHPQVTQERWEEIGKAKNSSKKRT